MGMTIFLVMRGFHPRIHLKKILIQGDGLPGQARQGI